MNAEFERKLNKAGFKKNALVALVDEIDQRKRSIANELKRLSSEPRKGDPVGRERQSKIRRMRTKQEHLKTEREIVRQRLADLKSGNAAVNRIRTHFNGDTSFAEAFLAAADELLDENVFNDVERRAKNILAGQKENQTGGRDE